MSAVPGRIEQDAAGSLAQGAQIAEGDGARALAFDAHGEIPLSRFLAQVRGVAGQLPAGRHVLNLCESRYRFLVALCASAARGQVTLLPPSRAPAVVADACLRHVDSHCLGDLALDPAPPDYWRLPAQLPEVAGGVPRVAGDALAVIGFTSGSTGVPAPHPKTWASFRVSTEQNLSALRHLWPAGESACIVATVPPQHMYGMEMSVLLPLLCDVAVHAGRPFFPHDIATALADAARNRLLVTTPVHLRALLASRIALPPVCGIVSATAPLSARLAAQAEERFGCEVRELFGSTETCVFAHRRTALESAWTLMPGVSITPQPDGAQVCARHLSAPVMLADLVELDAAGCFELRGRNVDLLEIAGKRASLGDLTRKLQAVPGVADGVVFQLDDDGAGVRRIAALAVAPGLDETGIVQAMRESVDAVFLPRLLRCVDSLPRNETGKLPRAALLSLLRGGAA